MNAENSHDVDLQADGQLLGEDLSFIRQSIISKIPAEQQDGRTIVDWLE
jgi:hypothetical protein